jgi:hypothetical protein
MIDEDYQHKNIKRLTDHLLKKIDEINDILKKMKEADVWASIDYKNGFIEVDSIKQSVIYHDKKPK